MDNNTGFTVFKITASYTIDVGPWRPCGFSVVGMELNVEPDDRYKPSEPEKKDEDDNDKA